MRAPHKKQRKYPPPIARRVTLYRYQITCPELHCSFTWTVERTRQRTALSDAKAILDHHHNTCHPK